MLIDIAHNVLRKYGDQVQPTDIVPLGSAGGYSGAAFWRVTTAVGDFCLRRWPSEHPTQQQLEYIHAVLKHVSARGVSCVAVPLVNRAGRTYLRHSGCFWEVTQWLPGRADYHVSPTREKLAAAMTSLASFHLAAATLPSSEPVARISSGLADRREKLARLMRAERATIAGALDARIWPEFEATARRLLDLFQAHSPSVAQQLNEYAQLVTPLQSCIRDIWHDHVLFVGDEVRGIVDFGAMRIESVAGDIARLLGSLVGDDQAEWRHGLAAYESIRALSAAERRLVSVFDRSSVLMSGMNWLQWIYVERRQFENREKILLRLHENIQRLERLDSLNALF